MAAWQDMTQPPLKEPQAACLQLMPIMVADLPCGVDHVIPSTPLTAASWLDCGSGLNCLILPQDHCSQAHSRWRCNQIPCCSGDGEVPDFNGDVLFTSDGHVEWKFHYRLSTGEYTFDYQLWKKLKVTSLIITLPDRRLMSSRKLIVAHLRRSNIKPIKSVYCCFSVIFLQHT